MSLTHKKSLFPVLITVPVVLLMIAAMTLAVLASMENLRFSHAQAQIFWLVNEVRTAAGVQKSFATAAGEDLWVDLANLGRIASTADHSNPWHGDVRAHTLAADNMRIESDMPTHDCRRMALYLLHQNMTDLGLISMEAQATDDKAWLPIYPQANPALAAAYACGAGQNSRLALIFKFR